MGNKHLLSVATLLVQYPNAKEYIEAELNTRWLESGDDKGYAEFIANLTPKDLADVIFTIALENLTWYTTGLAPFGVVTTLHHTAYVKTVTPSFYLKDEQGLIPVHSSITFGRFDDNVNCNVKYGINDFEFFDDLDSAKVFALTKLHELESACQVRQAKAGGQCVLGEL